MKKYLVMEVTGDESVSIARVEFTADLLAKVRARQSEFEAALSKNRDVSEMRFHEDSCSWFETRESAGLTDSQMDGPRALVLELLEASEEACRTEMDRMSIDSWGVSWSCSRRKCDETCQSYVVMFEDLELMALAAGFGPGAVVPAAKIVDRLPAFLASCLEPDANQEGTIR